MKSPSDVYREFYQHLRSNETNVIKTDDTMAKYIYKPNSCPGNCAFCYMFDHKCVKEKN